MNRMYPLRRQLLLSGLCLIAGCSRTERAGSDALQSGAPAVDSALFTKLPSSYTGVRFENRLTETGDLNVFTYRNFYNGGGAGIADLNGDGLPEIVLTSNLDGPRLYLNEGKFRFRDVTTSSGLKGNGVWTTGVAIADVNGDGLLDIFICHAGNVKGVQRANELYINKGMDPNSTGVPTFIEMGREYGLADGDFSTQAAFFDYDRDGWLDLLVINNSPRPVSSFGMGNTRNVRDAHGGHKLYHNIGGKRYVDVSASAGIYGSEVGLGLGVVASDVNRDGWPDLYISNDFFEHDYLYLNKGDGTFVESLQSQMPSVTYFSMGLDVADVNNDGWADVYTTDMLPEDEYRFKTMSSFEGWDVYQQKVRNGYHHQLMRNMLQLNNANGTFSDVGQMAGVSRTDWSWSALIADLDLDGYKDVFVTNGLAKDVTSQDYVAFLANETTMRSAMQGKRVDFLRLIAAMSSTKLPDYAFRNNGNLTFTNESAQWGLGTPSFSNGAAYGDLDGDGAPDLVVNNVNDEAFVFRNNARTVLPKNHYLEVKLEGEGANRFGVGSKVTLKKGAQLFYQELMPVRGFQSSVDYVLNFGVGQLETLDSVTVEWPDGRTSAMEQVAANQRLTIRHAASVPGVPTAAKAARPLFADVTRSSIDFTHRENDFVDFDRERLIPKMLSTEGPFMAVADVNGDGLDDAYIGGAKEQAGELLIQQHDGKFVNKNQRVFAQDKDSEDSGAAFFDANGDGHPDLYVVSGGSEFSEMASPLQDRLYLNDGRGNLRKAEGLLPIEHGSGSRVVAADYDADGDIDLFVGGRVVPWHYGIDPPSMLLRNDGRGRFTDVVGQLAPELAHVGMVTDALWRDVDGDAALDLVVVGEWMPISIFHNAGGGKLVRRNTPGLEKSDGWWNRLIAGDFTGDGRVDFIVGNLGTNTRLRATESEPATMYVKDFDRNGFDEQIVACYNDGASYPITLRDELIKALPYLKNRYLSYKDYARAKVTDIFSAVELSDAVRKTSYTFATSLVKNNGDGTFTLVPLPAEAQRAPVYGILASDFDKDGKTDLLLAGNFDAVKPEIGRMSGSFGLFLRGDGRGRFVPVRAAESGFVVPGQARDIQRVRTASGDLYVVTRNNDRALAFRSLP